MKLSRGAALTALCCLCVPLACGGPLEPSEDEHAGAAARAPDPTSGNDLPQSAEASAPDAEGEDDEDGPREVLAAPLDAWPFSLEAFAIDGAELAGETLVVAARSATGPLIVRLRKGEDGAPIERDRLSLERDQVSRVTLMRVADRLAAAWTAGGHLEVVFVDEAVAELGQAKPSRVAPEEGGAFAGDQVAARTDEGALICLVDGQRPLCVGVDAQLATTGVHPIAKRAREVPRALWRDDAGFLLVLSRCLGETCGRMDLSAIALDEDGGATGKARSLPEIQSGRGLVLVPDEAGLVLVARRVGAGEHSAWRVTPEGASELDGRYSRVVGGFPLQGRSLLVERSHLRMRGGFPVTGFQLRPLGEAKRKHAGKRDKIERESFPDAIEAQIPTEVDQTFHAGERAILFAGPRRQGTFRATAIGLPGGANGR